VAAAAERLLVHVDAPIRAVRLVVVDLPMVRGFYEEAVGMRVLSHDERVVGLGPPGGSVLLELVHAPGAPARPEHTTGLYRFALRVPDREQLGLARHRAVDAGWGIAVGRDLGVAESIYLDDPEGNGVEIYCDRPREEWPHDAEGRVQMTPSELDLGNLPAHVGRDGHAGGLAASTVMGHVHLHTRDLPAAEDFYCGVLGLEVSTEVPGALFLAAGGYHHHVALHYPEEAGPGAWAGVGAPPPPPGARGLAHVEMRVRDERALVAAEERLLSSGLPIAFGAEGLRTADPSGNELLLVPA
jgi:catechol 2,3-dioxygenase